MSLFEWAYALAAMIRVELEQADEKLVTDKWMEEIELMEYEEHEKLHSDPW